MDDDIHNLMSMNVEIYPNGHIIARQVPICLLMSPASVSDLTTTRAGLTTAMMRELQFLASPPSSLLPSVLPSIRSTKSIVAELLFDIVSDLPVAVDSVVPEVAPPARCSSEAASPVSTSTVASDRDRRRGRG